MIKALNSGLIRRRGMNWKEAGGTFCDVENVLYLSLGVSYMGINREKFTELYMLRISTFYVCELYRH